MKTLALIGKYYLIFVIFSFLGWSFEAIQFLIVNGKFINAGFLFLPVCTIYGSSIMLIYFLLGTVEEPRFLIKRIKSKIIRILIYFIVAFLIPTIMELLVGFIFDKYFHKTLWTYVDIPLNINGYISLIISFAWALLILLIMNFVFPVVKKYVFKINDKLVIFLSSIIGLSMLIDFIITTIKSL